MNIYLDIDGVILTKDGKQMPGLRNFLTQVFQNHEGHVYWLTTHCKNGTTERVFQHLGTELDSDLLDLLKSVKPTKWMDLKTEGIDFSQEFRWYDDNIFEAEKIVLRSHACENSWIQVRDLPKYEL